MRIARLEPRTPIPLVGLGREERTKVEARSAAGEGRAARAIETTTGRRVPSTPDSAVSKLKRLLGEG